MITVVRIKTENGRVFMGMVRNGSLDNASNGFQLFNVVEYRDDYPHTLITLPEIKNFGKAQSFDWYLTPKNPDRTIEKIEYAEIEDCYALTSEIDEGSLHQYLSHARPLY